MAFGSFAAFAKKVLEAAENGGLTKKDVKKLDRLLTRDGRRNKILAAGLVAALRSSANEKQVESLGLLFQRAGERIAEGKQPFTESEAETLRKVFKGAGVSEKTSRWISKHIDDLLAEEIKDYISGGRMQRGMVPEKKSFSLKKEIEKPEKEKKKLSLA